MFLTVVGYSTCLYGTGLDTGHNQLVLDDQEDFWSVMLNARGPPQDERINERTNEGTNERTNEGTNERTNERGIIRLLKRYDKINQQYFSQFQEI